METRNFIKVKAMHPIYDLLDNGRKAFFELSRNDRFMHAFWLLGPFFLLIERTPGDVYISIVALTFLIRSLKSVTVRGSSFSG